MALVPVIPTTEQDRSVKWNGGCYGVYVDKRAAPSIFAPEFDDGKFNRYVRDNSGIRFGLCRLSWSLLEPTRGNYEIQKIRDLIGRVPENKGVIFSFDDRNNEFARSATKPPIPANNDSGKLPVPAYIANQTNGVYLVEDGSPGQWKLWANPESDFTRGRMMALVEAFGSQFDTNPKVWGWMWDEISYVGFRDWLVSENPGLSGKPLQDRVDAGIGDFILLMGQAFYEHFPHTPFFVFGNWMGKMSAKKGDEIALAFSRWGHGWASPDMYGRKGWNIDDWTYPDGSWRMWTEEWTGHGWETSCGIYSKYGGWNKATDSLKPANQQRMPVLASSQMPSMRMKYGYTGDPKNKVLATRADGLRFINKSGANFHVMIGLESKDVKSNLPQGPHFSTQDTIDIYNVTNPPAGVMPRSDLPRGFTRWSPNGIPGPSSASLSNGVLSWVRPSDLTKIATFAVELTGPSPQSTVIRSWSVGKANSSLDISSALTGLTAGSTYPIKVFSVGSATGAPRSEPAVYSYSVAADGVEVTEVCVDFTATPDEVTWALEDDNAEGVSQFDVKTLRSGQPNLLGYAGPDARKLKLPSAITLPTGSLSVEVKAHVGSASSAKTLTWTNANTGKNCTGGGTPPEPENCDIIDPLCVRPLYENEASMTGKPTDPACASGFYSMHETFIANTASGTGKSIVFVGDSITARWKDNGLAMWNKHFDARSINVGRGGDKIQYIAWRVRAGWANKSNFKTFGHHGTKGAATSYFRNWTPKVMVLLAGTNNTTTGAFPTTNGAALCAQGIVATAQYFVQTINPNGVVLILQVPPAKGASQMAGARAINEVMYGPMHNLSFVPADSGEIKKGGIYLFPLWELLVGGDPFAPTFNQAYFVDSVHPNATGYQRIAEGAGSGSNAIEGLDSVVDRILGVI